MEIAEPRPVRRTAAHLGLLLLTLINLLNYIDRYVVPGITESLRDRKLGLGLSDEQVGWLQTGFIVVYAAISPIFGRLGDRGARTRLIAMGVAIWSAATALGGLAGSFAALLVARSAVGIGEAAYGTIAPSMLADYYPRRLRGRVFALFFAAIPVGSALGYVVAGYVGARHGWRSAFFVAGIPGLLLAALTLLVRDPPRGIQDGGGTTVAPPGGIGATYLGLLRNGAYVLAVLGYAAYTFAIGGMGTWMPSFLERVRHLSREQSTQLFGAVVVVTGLAGTFLGGWLGDAFLKRTSQAYLWVSGIATLLAVPLVIVALTDPRPAMYWPAMVAGEVLLFVSTGPINSAIVNVVSPTERATAVALSIFAMHFLGDVPAPPLIGAISDAYARRQASADPVVRALSEAQGLERAIYVVPVAVAIAGLIWCAGAWVGARRRRAA